MNIRRKSLFNLRISKWFNDLSILKKMYLSNIIIIPIIIVIIVVNIIYSHIIVSQVTQNELQYIKLIVQNFNNFSSNIEGISNILVANQQVQEFLRSYNRLSEEKKFSERLDITTNLDSIIGKGNTISAIILYDLHNPIASSGNKNNLNEVIFPNTKMFKTAINAWGKPLWVDFTKDTKYESSNYVSLIRSIVDEDTGSVIGVLKININENNISSLYTNGSDKKTNYYLVVNKVGKVISSDKKEYLFKDVSTSKFFQGIRNYQSTSKMFDINGNRYLVASNKFDQQNWFVIRFIPYQEVIGLAEKVNREIYVIGIIAILLEIVVLMMMARSISQPIISLTTSMTEVGAGNLDLNTKIKRNDEVGSLARTFNQMLKQISGLMDQIYKEQKAKRELELIALQAQIKPHFLYNTLESICSLIQIGVMDEAFIMVKALSMFYRGVLSKGNNVISIREEMEDVKHYLRIQQIRYREKFDCKIEIESQILDKKIVKLSIQPILENAIYHGVRNKRGKGTIQILGNERKGTIEISIIDDGMGFPVEQIKEIFSKETETRRGFGIRNVDERIKLFFGASYGIYITSEFEKGTRVDIKLPNN